MEKTIRSSHRKRDLFVVLFTTAVGVITAFIFSKAFIATWFVPIIIAAAFEVLWSYIPTLGIIQRVCLDLSFAVVGTVMCWHFYLEPLHISQKSQMLSGDLFPSRATEISRFPVLNIGPKGVDLTGKWDTPTPRAMFKFERNGEMALSVVSGRVIISTPIRDRDGHLVAEITENHWQVYPPYCSGKNFTRDAFEVKDASGRVVFQARLRGTHAEVQGIWRNESGEQFEFINSEVMNLGAAQYAVELVPMFKYPESTHLGEFSEEGLRW